MNVLAAYPTAAAYVAALPDGLDSHPDCLALEVHDGARQLVLDHGGLEEPIASMLGAQWTAGWGPEVHGMVAEMMLVDTLGETAYLQWLYAEIQRIYNRPILRHLMRLLSPSLVLMGGASRWGAVHRGSRLSPQPSRRDGDRVTAVVELQYPPALYSSMSCRAVAESIRAAVDLAHASGASVDVVSHGPERAVFDVAWDR